MAKLIVTAATQGHIDALLASMRGEDALEARALGLDPPVALALTLDASTTILAAVRDDELLCLCGVTEPVPMPGGEHRLVWCVTTAAVVDHWLAFARASRDVLAVLLAHHGLLGNWVSAEHHRAIRWLSWLGADLEAAAPHGPRGELFHRFTFGRRAA